MTRRIEYTELETRSYIPDELFMVSVSAHSDPGETPYDPALDYTIRFDWFDKDDEVYTKTTTPAVTATALTGPDTGITWTLPVPASITALWPITGCRGVCRIQSGAGETAETMCAFDMVLSDFAKNLG